VMMHTLTLHTHAALMGDAGVSTHTSKRRQEQQKITLSNCFHKRDSGSKQTVQQAGVLDSSQATMYLRCSCYVDLMFDQVRGESRELDNLV